MLAVFGREAREVQEGRVARAARDGRRALPPSGLLAVCGGSAHLKVVWMLEDLAEVTAYNYKLNYNDSKLKSNFKWQRKC